MPANASEQLDLAEIAADNQRQVAPPSAAPHALRAWILALIVVLWALNYLRTYVPAHGNGSDFQVFYAAAYADLHGVDAYDWPSFWRVEQQLFNGGLGHTRPFIFAPYANTPPFALLLHPFVHFAWPTAYRIWATLVLGAAALGGYLCLAGWPRRSRLLCTLLITISPATLFNLRLGQTSTFVLLSFGLCITLLALRRPALAGIALSTGLHKPHLMIPIALVLVLSAPPTARKQLGLGLLCGTAAWLAIGIVFDGGVHAYVSWLRDLRDFTASIRAQPDIASLPGLYFKSAAPSTIGVLNVVSLGLAALLIWGFAAAARGDALLCWRLLGGGIGAYMSLSPYVHTGDQVLLALPLLVLIGRDGAGLSDIAVFTAALACILCPMVVLRDYHTVGINALPPLTILLAYAVGTQWVPAHLARRPATTAAVTPSQRATR